MELAQVVDTFLHYYFPSFLDNEELDEETGSKIVLYSRSGSKKRLGRKPRSRTKRDLESS